MYLGEALCGVLQQTQHFEQWTLQFRSDDCLEKSSRSKTTACLTPDKQLHSLIGLFSCWLAVSIQLAHPRPETRSSSAVFWQRSRGFLRSPSSCWSTAPPCCASRCLRGGSALGNPTEPSSDWSSAAPGITGIKIKLTLSSWCTFLLD